MITKTEYQSRRHALMQQMDANSIAIITTKPEYPRAQDINFRYRPDGNFYYLTGFDEPEAIAVLITSDTKNEYILFNRERDEAQEMWHGHRAGQAGAVNDFLADQSYPIEMFEEIMLELIVNKKILYYQFGAESGIDEDIIMLKEEIKANIRKGASFPSTIVNVTELVNEMRAIKSDTEIKVLAKASAINVEAHTRAMKNCHENITELQLCSELNYVYGQHNCLNMAYPPIVATGDNGCCLHYLASTRELKDGELVLIDMGEEYQYYTSDITRTLPVNGKFNPEQTAIYELVLSVQEKIIAMVKPGLPFNEMQDKAAEFITDGLLELGLLTGNKETLMAEKAYTEFYPHRSGHWMGIDVHDVSHYQFDGQWRNLEAGMVLTVEPGIYIQSDNTNVDKKWLGIAVRIEDDIVVTETGNKNLTEKLPKTISEIEALMAA